jgi:prevent-host-death family protein
MTTISIRELEENLERMFTRVEDGETLEITRHGRVVARVVPVASGPPEDPDETWKRLSEMARESAERFPGTGSGTG